MPGTIRLVDPDGAERDVPVETAASVLQDPRWRISQTEDTLARLSEQAKEADYGGVGGTIAAGAAGLARGVTLGGSDLVARALGGEQAAIDLGGLRDVNRGVSLGTEIVGAAGPALISGGASLPAGAASAVGQGAARAAGGGLRGAIAGGVVEGSLQGLGSGVSELALSTDRITLARAASTLTSSALYGAAAGGAAAGLATGGARALARAKGVVDEALERRLAKAKTPDEAIETGDLERLDARQLRAARDAELEKLHQAGQPQRAGFVDDIEAVRKESLERQVWNATRGAPDRETRRIGRDFLRADKKLDGLLADRVTLAEHPERALSALRARQQALDTLDDLRIKETAAFDYEIENAPAMIRAEIASRNPESAAYKAGAVGPFTEAGLDFATEREILRRYGRLESPLRPKRLDYLDRVPEELAANRDLLRVLEGLSRPPVSERLSKIEDALQTLGAPKTPSLGEAVLGAAAPFAGPLGAAAAAGNRVLGNFRKLADAAATRMGKAASRFLDVTSKAAAKGAKYTPPLATRVLAAARFASEDDRPRRRPEKAPEPKTLHEIYLARTNEVKSQVEIAPDGRFQMKAAARAKMATRFDAIRSADPVGADQFEEMGARRIEYLASIMPRLPDYGVMMTGPEHRRVPELAMRTWARAVAALEDPQAVFERAINGRVVPAEAAAIREVMPELMDDFVAQVVAELPTLQRRLPRKRRLALSILTGVPVEPAMTPGVLNIIQGMYATEPGSAGGTQAPVPQPQFGSVKRVDPGTASQQREERAA